MWTRELSHEQLVRTAYLAWPSPFSIRENGRLGLPFFINSTDKNEPLIADGCTISSFSIGSQSKRSLRRRHCTLVPSPKRALGLGPQIRGGDVSKATTWRYKTTKTKRRRLLWRPSVQFKAVCALVELSSLPNDDSVPSSCLCPRVVQPTYRMILAD